VYFCHSPRHVLKRDVPVQLTCGAQFDGRRPQLELSHLRWYSCAVQSVLTRVPEKPHDC
jgi:hypothetical protein